MSEKVLCVLWQQQRWVDLPLSTAGGQSLHVVYPGRHTFDHGPDFRDALLALDEDLVRGDVEIHVRAADWRLHGHQRDAHYDRVALHVVWHDDGLAAVTAAGRLLPVLALQRHASLDSAGGDKEGVVEEAGMLPCFGPPCRDRANAMGVLSDLAEQRLAAKAAAVEGALALQDSSQVFYSALLDALGYSTNREACRRLAENVPWQVLASAAIGVEAEARVSVFEALLLGAAGLLTEDETGSPTDDGSYAVELRQRWGELNAFWRIIPMRRRDWRFGRVRPENSPPRRLAAGARLLAPYARIDPHAAFLGVIRSEDSARVAGALEQVIGVPAIGYWATHHDFQRPAKAPTQLLGRARAADIAVNVVLPFAVAHAQTTEDTDLALRARSAYLAYPPLAENELTRYTARLVFGRIKRRGLRAAHQQGLLHAYHGYCREKRCYECPLGSES